MSTEHERTAQVLAQRYGAPAPWRRRALLAATLLVTLVAAAWVVWAGWAHSSPPVTSNIETFDIIDEHTATVTLVVDLRDDDVEADCLVRAFAADHSNVGEAELQPDPGEGPRHTVEIRTEREATSVEVVGCRTAEDPRYR